MRPQKQLLVFVLVIASTVSYVVAQSCTCDITANECDVNCCCDPDCSTADRAAYFSGGCLPEGLASSFNLAGLPTYSSDAAFEEVFQQVHYTYQNSVAATTSSLVQTAYKYGDPIQVQYSYGSSTLSASLPFPGPTMTNVCDDGTPARFLVEQSSACGRIVDNATFCASGSPFDPAYYTGYKVILDPATAATGPISTSAPFCIASTTGSVTACASTNLTVPIFDPTTNTCAGAVMEVGYTVTYTVADGVAVIAAVLAQFTLGDAVAPSTSSSSSIQQRFSISFQDIGKTGTSTDRSGNPGYIVGRPIITATGSGTPIAIGPPITAIKDVYSPYTDTISCAAASDTGNRVPVTYGNDILTGCTLNLSLKDFQSCDIIRDQIWDLQTTVARDVSYIGRTGNPDVNIANNWAQIINFTPDSLTGSSSSSDPLTCINLLTGFSIEFITADVGGGASAQSIVTGARYRYSTGEFKYSCSTPADCSPTALASSAAGNVTQPFRITTSISFVSLDKVNELAMPDPPKAFDMGDIFYPFHISASGARSTTRLPRKLVWLWAMGVATAIEVVHAVTA
ncbi:hypothetical protein DFJ77DRAFT_448850 [Powellomyces hirtus]|nr:hypothetical protein DFJ77DRAFT_448850 [Powellomyces hirtus]